MPYQNMTLPELARHTGIDARELERLASRGGLPGRQVGGQWRFNRAQLLDWLQREMHTQLSPRQLTSLATATSPDAVPLSGMLALDAIELHFSARSRASVAREIVAVAERTGLVYDPDELIGRLQEREELGSTALPGGLAIPHPRHPLPFATAEPLIALARSQAGIPYAAPDGGLTHIFVLVTCHDDRQHLHTLAKLSLMFKEGLARRLFDAEDNEAALRLFLDAEAQ